MADERKTNEAFLKEWFGHKKPMPVVDIIGAIKAKQKK